MLPTAASQRLLAGFEPTARTSIDGCGGSRSIAERVSLRRTCDPLWGRDGATFQQEALESGGLRPNGAVRTVPIRHRWCMPPSRGFGTMLDPSSRQRHNPCPCMV